MYYAAKLSYRFAWSNFMNSTNTKIHNKTKIDTLRL